MDQDNTKTREIYKFKDNKVSVLRDKVAVEEPLEIGITAHGQMKKNISVTMRTPGNDTELAMGFLFTEGIILDSNQIKDVQCDENKVNITLLESVHIDFRKLERHFYTTSSCGICGKSSIDSIRTECQFDYDAYAMSITPQIILSLTSRVREEQNVFEQTGGLHACALFDMEGLLIRVFEDVGRHNALDKLIGDAFLKNELPLNKHLLLLSGRASFELIQKSAMAGIRFILSVGAPSSLAVELADEFGLTLIGFLSDKRFNIYSGHHRVKSG